MAAVCFYFQVHKPFRLRNYSVFDTDPFYFDNEKNREILLKVADKCYRPTTRLLLDLVKRHDRRFRVSFSLSGVVLEQLEQWAPDVIVLFQELGATGACEFIAETSHHSLSFLFSRAEFNEQVALQEARIERLFGQQRAGNQCQRRILRAGNRDRALKAVAALDDQLVHGSRLSEDCLGRKSRAWAGTSPPNNH